MRGKKRTVREGEKRWGMKRLSLNALISELVLLFCSLSLSMTLQITFQELHVFFFVQVSESNRLSQVYTNLISQEVKL